MHIRLAGSPKLRLSRYLAASLAVAAAATLALTAMPAGAATDHQPIGHLDKLVAEPGGVRVIGWAADPDAPHTSLDFTLFNGDGSSSQSAVAHDPRPDVAKAYPSFGQYHGINMFLPSAAGTYRLCVKALDSAAGPSLQFGCTQLTIPADRNAIGHLDSVRPAGSNRITITGWGADQDTPNQSATINVLLGSSSLNNAYNAFSLRANQSRPDIAAAYPSLGAGHGFSLTVTARPGTYPVCGYVFDTYTPSVGAKTSLGCITVTVAS